MKKEYYFPSADDLTQIHVCEWTPEGEPKAILQIGVCSLEQLNIFALLCIERLIGVDSCLYAPKLSLDRR